VHGARSPVRDGTAVSDSLRTPSPDGCEAKPVIELRDVVRTYPGSPPVHALRGIDLVVRQGEHLSIVGPSGSGKSTLLHTLGLLDRPTSGTYLLGGVETTELGDAQRAVLRGSRIGFVFQSFHLLPHRTVEENVMLAELYHRPPVETSRSSRRKRALAVLDRVGMGHRAGFRPVRLSGGERQRVAIARALLTEPEILLCDEPTGNLDTDNTAVILDLFDELREQGVTLLVITHDAEVSRRAGRSVRINDGVLRAERG
jgi:putative ABC transport system ATP-binding protein